MVYERIREYLKRAEIKQSWLAARLGLSAGSLSLILSGRRKLTADEVETLCATLCVPPDVFIRPDERTLKPYTPNTPDVPQAFRER